MKAKNLILLVPVLLAFIAGCTKESHYQKKVVVEGWIDDGGYPVVILSKNVNISSGMYSLTDSTDVMALWAKCSIVRDDTDTTILMGKVDKRYMPPYIYTTWKFKGEAGRKYELIVEYDRIIEKAVTVIPEPQTIDEFTVEKTRTDSLYCIKAKCHNMGEGHYYKFFTMVDGVENRYFASYLGDIEGGSHPEEVNASVNKGRYHTRYSLKDENGDKINEFTPYFTKDEVAQIKFAKMNRDGFEFWQSFSNDANVSALLYPPKGGLSSNITVIQDEYGPQNYKGNGSWIGYGATFYTVKISDYIE